MSRSKKSGESELPVYANRRDLLIAYFREQHPKHVDLATMRELRVELEKLMSTHSDTVLRNAIQATAVPAQIAPHARRVQREAGSASVAPIRTKTVRKKQVRETIDALSVGETVKGAVTSTEEFGAFVSIDQRRTGHVSLSEIAWGQVSHPSEHVKVGQRVSAKIIAIDRRQGLVSLSIKQTLDPWKWFRTTYSEGDLLVGKVTGAKEFGAFVEFAPRVSGLLHRSQLPTVEPEQLPIGLELWVRLLTIDAKNRKLALSARGVAAGSATVDGRRPVELGAVLVWNRVGVRLPEIEGWQQRGFRPSDAGPWIDAGSNADTALEWRDAGFGVGDFKEWLMVSRRPDIVSRWRDAGFGSEDAQSWAEIGVGPAAVDRWVGLGWSRDEITPWAKLGLSPSEAQDWVAINITADLAAAWRSRGFTPSEAGRWTGEGFSLENSTKWRDAGFGSEDAQSWAEIGVGPGDVDRWGELGWSRDQITPWAKLGMPPSEAQDWVAINITADLAAAWRSRGFTPSEAGAWTGEGFSLEDSTKWRDAGFDSATAKSWVDNSWNPKHASEWRAARWDDPVEARRWHDAGWGAESARNSAEAGMTPSGKDMTGGFGRPAVTARSPKRPGDRFFGSPRTNDELQRWGRPTRGLTGPPMNLSPEQRHQLQAYRPPARLGATDVIKLREQLIARVHDEGWPEGLAGLAHFAVPCLVDAPEINLMFRAEPPPAELLPDVELPFDQVMLLFAGRFNIGQKDLAQLPTWSPGSARSGLPYEAWLAHMTEVGASLAGVILQTGTTGSGIADECVWLVEVSGVYVPVPSFRSRSAFLDISNNLAAALCFGSWCKGLPGRRLPGESRGGAQTRRRALPPVHVVTVRRKGKTPKSVRGGNSRRSASHVRRGHWHRYWVGSGQMQHQEWRWVGPTRVGAYVVDTPDTIYKLPRLMFAWGS